MDFSWTEDQIKYKNMVVNFAQKELNDEIIDRDRKCELARNNWKKCAQIGILGLTIPEEYGGNATDILTAMLVMEGLGYGCKDNGLIFSMNAQIWSVQHPIFEFGNENQKRKYLPGLCSGEIIGAHAMSEADSGSDAFSLRTKAERISDGYILNGTKMFVTNAPVADVVLVFANINSSKGREGLTAFLVDTGTHGYRVGSYIEKMGLRTSPMSEVILEDCVVPVESRLGTEGTGASIFYSSMEWERSFILGSYIGAMERQLEDAIRYARERHQFTQPIGKFQSVSNRIADMKVRLETARLLLYKVAWLKKNGKPAFMESALAKLYLSECFVNSSIDTIRTFGGYGYMTELEFERDLRDSIGGLLYSGTSDIQRTIIARWLGL